MARLVSLQKDLQLCVEGIAPDKIASALAAFARAELAKTIADGTGSSEYEVFVNGRLGASEDAVQPPGPIVYKFSWWRDVIQFALQTLIDLSPELSGEYKRSWIIRADGQQVANPKDINVASVVEITNTQPFHRSIVVGNRKYRLGHQSIEAGRQRVNSVWGNFITAKSTMIQLPGGYVLKGRFKRGFRKYARRKARPDVGAGQPMQYPTLQLSIRGL